MNLSYGGARLAEVEEHEGLKRGDTASLVLRETASMKASVVEVTSEGHIRLEFREDYSGLLRALLPSEPHSEDFELFDGPQLVRSSG